MIRYLFKGFSILFLSSLFFSRSQAQIFHYETISYGSFGKLALYKPLPSPKSFVILVSGESGWNGESEGQARYLAQTGAMVAGVDLRHFMTALNRRHGNCCYPASDFETLSLMLQKKSHFPQYVKPVLVGLAGGSFIVYGCVAQAPANTFKGAIAENFQRKMAMTKPLCKGSGLRCLPDPQNKMWSLEPDKDLTAPFIILGSQKRNKGNHQEEEDFLQGMKMGQWMPINMEQTGSSDKSDLYAELGKAYTEVMQSPSYTELKAQEMARLHNLPVVPLPDDLPITVIPSAPNKKLPMVFFLSGDGGWTSFDQNIGEAMAEKGLPVVGLDDQRYFWNAKSPDEVTTMVEKAVQHFMRQWGKKQYILMGYSFGACVIPFVAGRLSPEFRESLLGIYCISPDRTADFEIHIADMLNLGNKDEPYQVPEQIKKIPDIHSMCIFGEDEDTDVQREFRDSGTRVIVLPGGHHYNNETEHITEIILRDLRRNTIMP